MIAAVSKRRKQIRKDAIAHKGGKCSICGYSKCLSSLEFHHLDNSKKEFGISKKGYTRSWQNVSKELEKCILVCANCHREIHEGVAALDGNIEMQTEFRAVVPSGTREKSGELREA